LNAPIIVERNRAAGTRLENRRVAARLDRARLLTLHRLVGRHFRELRDVDLRQLASRR
jgi:hypothetical protein